MRTIILSLFVGISSVIQAQYYYNDILGAHETTRQMKSYVANKVKTVAATGYDNRGVKATDFSELREIKENGTALRISAINGLNKSVVFSRFDSQGRIISITDSSTESQSITTYEYDVAGRISKLQNTIKDTANDFNQVETHVWLYNTAGKPEKMWRIIVITDSTVRTDSLELRFVTDEDGNVGEERTFKKGIETGYLYYYYDDNNRLSDIVRYNEKRKRLMPDLMFEYDENGLIAQKITTTSSLNLNYLIWRYIYNEKGLKTKEALFNNDKELTGRIEYSYTFQP
jgi:YD repeat-containing protein